MILTYYKTTNNFGDALNPLIFNHYLPDFFDDNPESIFLGIGTILGLEKGTSKTKKIIVFSSGYGKGDQFTYGEPPKLDNKYEIICLRGPLTAKFFGLDPALAISDGALLLKDMPFHPVDQTYNCSYLPHHVSEDMFSGWKELVESEGIHYISPQDDALSVIQQIRKSKLIITEAMHGAIVADVFRVPWIPVKSFSHINEFKWNDWAFTVNMNIRFHVVKSLFNDKHIQELLNKKIKITKYKPVGSLSNKLYKLTRQKQRKKFFVHELRLLKRSTPYLSHENLLNEKVSLLREKIELITEKYGIESTHN
ncbi:MAG: polysaccharide pyruvyl transferase family protein [Bacteroidota bacterium]